MSKKKKIILLVLVVLVVVGGGVGFWLWRKSKAKKGTVDKFGNVFELREPSTAYPGHGLNVYVNGKPDGILRTLTINADGYATGSNGSANYIFKNGGWNQLG